MFGCIDYDQIVQLSNRAAVFSNLRMEMYVHMGGSIPGSKGLGGGEGGFNNMAPFDHIFHVHFPETPSICLYLMKRCN